MLRGVGGDVDDDEAGPWVSWRGRDAQPSFSPVSSSPVQVGAMAVSVKGGRLASLTMEMLD